MLSRCLLAKISASELSVGKFIKSALLLLVGRNLPVPQHDDGRHRRCAERQRVEGGVPEQRQRQRAAAAPAPAPECRERQQHLCVGGEEGGGGWVGGVTPPPNHLLTHPCSVQHTQILFPRN